MHKTLREIAKFASGLIFGDFLYGLWLYFGGYTPIRILGVTYTDQMVLGGIIFDLLLLTFLIHYGWRMPERSRTSAEKKFHLTIGILLSVVALLHFLRIVFGLSFVIGTWNVPYWLNGLGALVTAFFAYISFNLFGREK